MMQKIADGSVLTFKLASCSSYALASWFVIFLLLVAASPLFYFSILRIPIAYPINFAYNEGWNVIHTVGFLKGEPLYVPLDRFPLTPVNYPPLSFVFVGGLSYLLGSVLLTGRIVALVSLLFVGYLVYRIVEHITGQKLAAFLGAAVWLTLTSQFALIYVGYDDPQLMAHAFSFGAFYLFIKWQDNLSTRKIYYLAFLCCVALFTKHLLIPVPLSIAITLLSRRRGGEFLRFILGGIVISSILLLATWVYSGNNFFSNFLDTARRVSPEWRWQVIIHLFVYDCAAVVFLPLVYLCLKDRKPSASILIYLSISLLVGSYVCGGVGVDVNAWFDFFLAASIVYGLFAATEPGLDIRPWFRPLVFGLIACGFLANEVVVARYLSSDGAIEESTTVMVRLCQIVFLVAGLALVVSKDTTESIKTILFTGILSTTLFFPIHNLNESPRLVFALDDLRSQEKLYQNDVEFLRSISGPALFESLLLGYDAGKKFLFDPFAASQLMVARRIPEKLLVRRIQAENFGVIVLTNDLDEMIGRLKARPRVPATPQTTVTDRWTDNTLLAMKDNYHRVTSGRAGRVFFYVPNNTARY